MNRDYGKQMANIYKTVYNGLVKRKNHLKLQITEFNARM
jgi:hypothetical protein